MAKLNYLFPVLFVLIFHFAKADIVATGEDITYAPAPAVAAQPAPSEQMKMHINFADMVDTGEVISQAEIARTQVASASSVHVDTPPANCRIFTTRASFYSKGSHVAYRSQRFHPEKDTMATRDIKLGSTVYVKVRGSNDWIKGTANDYGPFVNGRGADLSLGYAKSVNFPLGAGVAKIQVASCDDGDEPSYYATQHKRRKG